MNIPDVICEIQAMLDSHIEIQSHSYIGIVPDNALILEDGFVIDDTLVKYQDITSIYAIAITDVDYDEDGFVTPIYDCVEEYIPNPNKPYRFMRTVDTK